MIKSFIRDFKTQQIWMPLHEFETDIYVTSSAGAAATDEVQVKAYAIAVG